MAQSCDPLRLKRELITAGIPVSAFGTVRSGGPLPTIDWAPGHPTSAEDSAAQAALAAHDPDGAEAEDAAERQRIRDLEAIIGDAATPILPWRAAVAEHARLVAKRTGANRP